MNLIPPLGRPQEIDYPESDGQPMSDNTKQFRWIFVLYGNIAALFHAVADVFVSGNQNWYPVEGHPEIVNAPDVYVVFGRPKGDRPSWKQWEEDNVPMTVVFEVLSPKNTVSEMARKFLFYEDYGVEEYYIYDPDDNYLQVFLRNNEVLRRVHKIESFVSPRLGIRFDLTGEEMVVYRPDGQRFLTFEELDRRANEANLRADQAKQLADEANKLAEQANQRADQAEQRAEQLSEQVEQANRRADRLAELALKVQSGEATPEDLQELLEMARPSGPGST